jgi:hypothetical protein
MAYSITGIVMAVSQPPRHDGLSTPSPTAQRSSALAMHVPIIRKPSLRLQPGVPARRPGKARSAPDSHRASPSDLIRCGQRRDSPAQTRSPSRLNLSLTRCLPGCFWSPFSGPPLANPGRTADLNHVLGSSQGAGERQLWKRCRWQGTVALPD